MPLYPTRGVPVPCPPDGNYVQMSKFSAQPHNHKRSVKADCVAFRPPRRIREFRTGLVLLELLLTLEFHLTRLKPNSICLNCQPSLELCRRQYSIKGGLREIYNRVWSSISMFYFNRRSDTLLHSTSR